MDRTAGTKQPGQDSQDKKAETGELRQESQKDRKTDGDRTARIGNRAERQEYCMKANRTAKTEQLVGNNNGS